MNASHINYEMDLCSAMCPLHAPHQQITTLIDKSNFAADQRVKMQLILLVYLWVVFFFFFLNIISLYTVHKLPGQLIHLLVLIIYYYYFFFLNNAE